MMYLSLGIARFRHSGASRPIGAIDRRFWFILKRESELLLSSIGRFQSLKCKKRFSFFSFKTTVGHYPKLGVRFFSFFSSFCKIIGKSKKLGGKSY